MDVKSIASNRALQNYIFALIKKVNQGEIPSHVDSTELKVIREYLEPLLKNFSYIGFSIFNSEGLGVGSSFDEAIGSRWLVSTLEGERFFRSVSLGNTAITLPFKANIELPDREGVIRKNSPTILIGSPINYSTGKFSAAIVFHLRPEEVFTDIFAISNFNKSGETYAFDKTGRMLTASRFDDDLRRLGLLGSSTASLLNLVVKDPGGNLLEGFKPRLKTDQQPFTRMIKSAHQGESGSDIEGYRDYRGVKVVGAWSWFSEFRFGVTSEIDYEEAYKTYFEIRQSFFNIFGFLVFAVYGNIWLIWKKSETQNELAEQESVANDLIQLIDTANAPIFGIDAAGLVNEWNQRAELLTGFDKADVMGKDLVDGFITDDYKVSVKEVLDKALKGEETANYEFPLFTKSGDRVDVLLNSTSRRDSGGNIIGVVGVGHDITELRHTQSQVIQASKQATLGEMATSVAHELNQPLNVIRMAAGNSRRKISKGTADPEYLNAKLERIEEQTARAAAIIDHMMMFGRKAEEKPGQIDPRQVVTNALDLMGEQLRLAGIEIVTELPEDCSSILGHIIQMEQVIINLLTNARDAMTERDGKMKITLRVFENENGVHLTSQDTGGGIPKKVLPRIFEPFYTTKEMGKGTGLGLSVSYGIVRDMKGTIIAENIEDGARFTISIPAAT